MGAYIPDPFMALYSASKSALEGWTEGMSYELDRIGVSIKTIVPGFMQTNFVGNAQMIQHKSAYREDWEKVLTAYANPNAAVSADMILLTLPKLSMKNRDRRKEKSIHYFAGNNATTRYKELSLQGIIFNIGHKKKVFFDN